MALDLRSSAALVSSDLGDYPLIVEAPEWNQLRMPFAPENSVDIAPRRRISPGARLPTGVRTALFQRKLQDLKASAQGMLSTESTYRFACAAAHCALGIYWGQLQRHHKAPWPLPGLHPDAPLPALAPPSRELAEEIGALLAQYEPIAAGYRIGEIYTALLPAEFRSRHGVFYTPPGADPPDAESLLGGGCGLGRGSRPGPGMRRGRVPDSGRARDAVRAQREGLSGHRGAHRHPRARLRARSLRRLDVAGRPGGRADRPLPSGEGGIARGRHGL